MAEVFRCGHPRTPENLAPNGPGFICRTCKNARVRAAYARVLPNRPAPELAGTGQRGCSVEGCAGIHLARGLCRRHYAEGKRRGDFAPAPAAPMCTEAGCDRPVRARGLCRGHYQRASREGRLVRVAAVNAGRTCTEEGCSEPARVKGQCTQHYNYWKVIRQRYGIDRDSYERLVADHGSRCAICGTTDPGANAERWSIDHDHACCPGISACGECVRGLLCRNCNVGLGHFDDDPERLLAAAAYLMTRVDALRMAGGEPPSQRR